MKVKPPYTNKQIAKMNFWDIKFTKFMISNLEKLQEDAESKRKHWWTDLDINYTMRRTGREWFYDKYYKTMPKYCFRHLRLIG